MIDRDDRDRHVRPERAGALAREVFERLLNVGIDGERDDLSALRCADRLIGGVRREHRHRTAAAMHALGFRLRDFVGRNAAGVRNAIEHAVARAMRALGRTIGPPHFGRLRDRDQQRRFGEREAPRLLAEIGVRGGAHAFEIAAIGRKAEIEREDVVLAERAFELDRAHRLPQLCEEACGRCAARAGARPAW